MATHWHSWAWCFGHKEPSLKDWRGIPETQEMLDVCAERGIKIIRADKIETAYWRMLKADVTYRFVMDIETMDQ